MTTNKTSKRVSLLKKEKEIKRLRSLGNGSNINRDMMSEWYSNIPKEAREMKRQKLSESRIERHIMSSFSKLKSLCVLYDVIPENASLKVMQGIEQGMIKRKEYIDLLTLAYTNNVSVKDNKNIVWSIIDGYNLKCLTDYLHSCTITELGRHVRNEKAKERRKANKKVAQTTSERVSRFRAKSKPTTSKKDQTILDVQKCKTSGLTQSMTADKLDISLRTVKSYWTS